MISLRHLTIFSVCLLFLTHAHGMIIDPISESHNYIYDPVILPEGNITANITTNPLPTPNGVAFLGVGYNILTGNPEGGDVNTGGVDPGLLTTRKIFKLTYDDNNLSIDLRYQVPDEVVFAPRQSCVTTQVHEVFYGTKSYQEKIGVDVTESIEVGNIFAPFKFSMSTRYQQVQSSTMSSHRVYREERTVCNKGQARYRTELAFFDQYPLDEGFVADSCRLTAAYDKNLYMYFLEDWGTHVVSEVDVGAKMTSRYEEEQQGFVQYAMSKIGNSVSAHAGVGGYGLGIRVDMNLFKQSMTSETQFGRKTHTYTSGSDDMHEPIGIFLLGLFEIFDRDYWQLFDQYVEAGLCPSTWFIYLPIIQTNVEAAIRGYAEWKNDNPSDDPIVEIPVTWPQGTYGLPKPDTGCPNSHFTWAEGWRFHDTENLWSDNRWSDTCDLAGPHYEDDDFQNFCMKTYANNDIYEWSWPAGEYCIFRKGGSCPDGMDSGGVHWDDEDRHNDNDVYGTLPDGNYDYDTDIYYCCQTSGHAYNPIYLPVDDSFFLLRHTHQCQEASYNTNGPVYCRSRPFLKLHSGINAPLDMVYGMRYTEEWFLWDTQDTGNEDRAWGYHPYGLEGLEDDSHNIYLEYCYYEPI